MPNSLLAAVEARIPLLGALIFLLACGVDPQGPSSSSSGSGGGGNGSSSGGGGVGGPPSCPVPDHPWPTGVAGPPRVFFTDLQSGPSTGGEDGLGAFVTIFGEGFGAKRGNGKVTIGGAEVARYVAWGENNAIARGMDRIVVQLGPDNATGDLLVQVDGADSNAVPFEVRPASIYFVVQGAAKGGSGSADSPFASIYEPREKLGAGDIVYIRGGVFDELDPFDPSLSANLVISIDNAATGSSDAPIAYVGYPDEPPVIGSREADHGIFFDQEVFPVSFYLFSNLVFTDVDRALPLSAIGHRVVGSCFFDGGRGSGGVVGISAESSSITLLGNLFLYNGGHRNADHHAFQVGGQGTIENIEFAFNHVEDQRGGSSVHVDGSDAGDFVDDVWIHDNLFIGSERANVAFGRGGGDPEPELRSISFYNNVIVGSDAEGLRVDHPDATVELLQNTFFRNAGAAIAVERAGAGRIALSNNILRAEDGRGYVTLAAAADPSAVVAGPNLCFGAGSCPAWFTAPIQGDPLFFGILDFRLRAGSPAVDAGEATDIAADHVGTPRPAGAGYDLGAFERP
jgi:hypothetical protein